MIKSLSLWAFSMCISFPILAATPDSVPDQDLGWREIFNHANEEDGVKTPQEWELKSKWGVDKTKFFLVHSPELNGPVLRMEANNSTGTYLRLIKNIDLERYPVIRWCWRSITLPSMADGRDSEKDDQAIGVYIGTGRWKQNSIAYRWETLTPLQASGDASYGGGMVKVKWFCLCNSSTPLNQWRVEQRNVRDDFKSAYDQIPSEIAVNVVSNAQYTKTKSVAEIAWIEFITAAEAARLNATPDSTLNTDSVLNSDSLPTADTYSVIEK